MNGSVLWYDARKGFGSILGADGNKYFVHKSSLPFWTLFLAKGNLVEFLIEDNRETYPRGPVAKDIKIIGNIV